MTNGQNVRMIKCSKSEYDALTTKDDAALYFCTDKKMIFLGSILIASASKWDGLEEPSQSDPDDPLGYLTHKIVLSNSAPDDVKVTLVHVQGAYYEDSEARIVMQKGVVYRYAPDCSYIETEIKDIQLTGTNNCIESTTSTKAPYVWGFNPNSSYPVNQTYYINITEVIDGGWD